MSTVTQFGRERLLGAMLGEMERLAERLASRARERYEAAGDSWPRRVRAGLDALLEELAAEPRMARMAIRTFPAAGAEVRARYLDLIEGFVPLLREGRKLSGMAGELPAEVEMLAIGSVEAIVLEEINAGRAAQLPALSPALLYSALVPFLGPDAAAAEMERAQAELEQANLQAA